MRFTNVQDFCVSANMSEDQFYGREEIRGNLVLRSVEEIPEGFSPVVGGSLWLDNLEEIPKGFNPVVGSALWLNSLKEIPKGFNLTVGDSLSLNNLKEIPKGFNPVVGGSLWFDNLEEIPEGFDPVVGGSLWLNSLKEIPKGFNLVVGDSLSLNSLKEIPKGFNPTVGDSLWFNNLEEIPGGFNPVVGHSILLKNKLIDICNEETSILEWRDGKYCKIDGIFGEVISKKRSNDLIIRKMKLITRDEFFFVVSEDNLSAHGNTISQAMADLRFKKLEKDPSIYEDLSLQDSLSLEDAITCYRILTGACQFGVSEFLERLGETKESYTVEEILRLTENEYGGERFREFFMERA